MNRFGNSTGRQQLVGYLQAWARSLLIPFITVTNTPIQNCLLKHCTHIQEIWFSFLCQKNSIYSLKQALRAFQSAVHGALDTGDEKSQVRLTFKVEGDKGTHQLINMQHAIPLNGFRSSNLLISVFNIYVALTVADFTRLQIILGQWLDMITNWRNFCSVESHFWPVQIFRLE